jgi:hypothetical protein
VVLLCPGAAKPLVLRGTGVELWAAFARPLSVREVAAWLATVFQAEYELVRSDVAPVITRLTAAGALREVQ